MTRVAAALSLFVVILLVAAAVWYGGGGEDGDEDRNTPAHRITRVAFVPRPEGALALIEEARDGLHALNVLDLADGQLIDGRDYDGETDRRRGMRRLVGATASIVWLVSHDRGLHGRDPLSGAVSVRRRSLIATNPLLERALREDRETRYRFDLATGRLVIGVGAVWHRVDPVSRVAETVPAEELRLRTEGAQGYRGQRRYVELKGGTRVELARIGQGREARFDNIPTLISGDGRRMRLAEQLNLTQPLFLYDAATDGPITPARPASLILVQSQGRVLSRLALAGQEVWWHSLADLIPDDEEAASWARIGAAHLDGDRLVVSLGPRLLALDIDTGERLWSYPE